MCQYTPHSVMSEHSAEKPTAQTPSCAYIFALPVAPSDECQQRRFESGMRFQNMSVRNRCLLVHAKSANMPLLILEAFQ
jgi:hypothetical protein